MLRNDLYRPWFTNTDEWGFEILSGDYLGVVLQVSKLDLPAENESVDLEYHIINKPETLEEETLKGPEFSATIELVINDILREALEIYEQDRNSNT